MPRKASIDEFMSRHKAHVGQTQDGHEAVFKGFASPPSWKKDERAATFIMSSERIDRDGDIVRQKGLQLDAFNANPQALLFHSSRSWPIGQWSDIQKRLRTDPPRTEGKLNFAPEGGPIPEIDQAAWAVENGIVKTVSIGFMPHELELIEHDEKVGPWGYGFDIKSADLYECSLVPIPAQPDAVAKGLIKDGKFGAAKDFIEQALHEWARDPRTGMLIPRDELEKVYKAYFGKSAVMAMAIDAAQPDSEETALVKVDKAFKQIGISTKAVEDGDGSIEAVSGISININISQDGGTGDLARTGTDIGDVGEGATDGNPGLTQNDTDPPETKDIEENTQTEEPPKRKLLDVLMSKLFGEPVVEKEPDPPAPPPEPIPGSYDERKDRFEKLAARLQKVD
jgi:hypothetical protein